MNPDSIIKGNWGTKVVTIDGKELSPGFSQSIYNHSPNGFNWSYGGSGPAQLALALLCELTTPDFALSVYQDFKRDVIATLPEGDFELRGEKVFKYLFSNIRPMQK